MIDKPKQRAKPLNLSGMDFDDVLQRLIHAGRCRRMLGRRLRLRVLPHVPVQPPGNLPQERVEPVLIAYLPGVVAEFVLGHVLIQVARVNVVVRADQAPLED